MSIVLHIERLVIDEALLEGQRPGTVRSVLERELTQRLAQPGAVDTLRGVGTVTSLPPMPLASAGRLCEPLGMRIAVALQRGLGVSGDQSVAPSMPVAAAAVMGAVLASRAKS
jgi:hypothetical protein